VRRATTPLRWLGLTAACLCLARAAPAQQLQAGLAERDVTPVTGVPLAGYGDRHVFPDLLGLHPYAFYLAPSKGRLDPIRAKVLVLRSGSDALVFVALDVVGLTEALRQSILQEIAGHGFDPNHVLVSATHTHSGPGTMTENELMELLVTDRYESTIHDAFVLGIAGAVDAAVADLAPASLESVSFHAVDLQENRRGWPDIDRTANLLLVRGSGGAYRGAIVNFAVHGTHLPAANLLYSGDVPAAIATAFGSALGALNTPASARLPVLFVNGAEGDIRPVPDPNGMPHLGARFAQQAIAALPAATPVTAAWSVRSASVDLSTPVLYLEPWKSDVPHAVLLKWIGLDLQHWSPSAIRIWSIRLGDLRLLTWPGEPTTKLGLALRNLCSAAGARVWVLGLTNDYVGYFTTPDEFALGGYEAQNSQYGPHGGRHLLRAHCQLLASP
jgi:hypothetical protein